jgi:tetratricopeptide (TPR) repeat protein
MVLAGEFDRGAWILHQVADASGPQHPWWYMVGWSAMIAGRPGQAEEAFAKAHKEDGEYASESAKIAGDVSGFFLGKLSEEAFLQMQSEKLARFFIGERHLLSGERDKALAAYKRSARFYRDPPDPWPANWACVRLRQLDGQLPGLPGALPPSERFWEKAAPATRAASSAKRMEARAYAERPWAAPVTRMAVRVATRPASPTTRAVSPTTRAVSPTTQP